MAKVVGPTRNWMFIGRIASRVRALGGPASSKRCRLAGSDQLLALGLQLMEGASTEAIPLKAAIAFRDGLIIALLALRTLRRRNLTELTLGKDLLRTGSGWTILLPPSATKTHVTLEYAWPGPLDDALETYLTVHRPILTARRGRWYEPAGGHLWVSSDGSPFTQMGIYDRITQLTRAAFGRAINPHLFRDAAATTIAINDPVHVRSAAPLLGHRTFATTERHYNQAQSLEAHREFANKLITLRQQLISNQEPNP
jgi:site-specific recombinase XerC